MKSTAKAHPNIALIKYWGNRDSGLNLPLNGSISMIMGGASTTTTIEFSKDHGDEFVLNGEQLVGEAKERVGAFVSMIRRRAGCELGFKVVSENDFPAAAGLASSAGGFAALTIAACEALGMKPGERELSILARRGSGSACRSIPSGFVEWHCGETDEGSYGETLAPPGHLAMRDIVAVTDTAKKAVPSKSGHGAAAGSPFMEARLAEVKKSLKEMRGAITAKDFKAIGKIAEQDCLSMHAVIMTGRPPVMYWSPATLRVMDAVMRWRAGGLACYFTIDAGPNVHVLCMADDEKEVAARLNDIDDVEHTIVTRPAGGAGLVEDHLF